MELLSHGIQMYSTHREHSFTIGASNWLKTQNRSSFYTIGKIKLHRNIMKLSSRSSKWVFLRNFPFQPMSQDRQFGVSIHLTRYGSKLWFLSQLPNLPHTGVGWKIPTGNSENMTLHQATFEYNGV